MCKQFAPHSTTGGLSTILAVSILFASCFEAALGQQNQFNNFTSVDVMKLSKDVVTNQPSAAEIGSIVDALLALHSKYIALSVPLDASTDYKSGKPAPQTAEAFTQTWADAIHSRNLKILWRGTWSGIEGLYGFSKLVGPNRFPAGSAATAAADGQTTWLGKTYSYIVSHPDYFLAGDIWAPLPERTENIFQDATSFLPYNGGVQNNYLSFFRDLATASKQAFASINKEDVITGWTANNFTEIKSGWLPQALFNSAGTVAVDYYGTTHTAQEMTTDLLNIYRVTGRQIFVQEWSDYWDGNLSDSQRHAYLDSMYAAFTILASQGVLVGFNYWGGWTGAAESILDKTSSGYQLNSRGLQLAEFFSVPKRSFRRFKPLK